MLVLTALFWYKVALFLEGGSTAAIVSTQYLYVFVYPVNTDQ